MQLTSNLFAVLVAIAPVMARTNFHGIATSNSLGNKSSYTCRSQEDWNKLAKYTRNNGFKSIRLTGFDCNALELASNAAAANGLTIMAGIYISGSIASASAQIDKEVAQFRVAHAKFGSARYAGLTIGNEVNDSAANIMKRVYDVRGYLSSVGISTPVSTVHTWVRVRDDKALCGADFVGINAHTCFDGGRTSQQAGDFIFKLVVPEIKKACPGKKIYITETGWPSAGPNNGRAVASINDQYTALLNINCACASDPSVAVYAFEYDQQTWKGNEWERSFGFSEKIDLKSAFASC